MKSQEKVKKSLGTPLTRSELKLISGGVQEMECHCYSPAPAVYWGCVGAAECMSGGDEICGGSSYSCAAV